MDHSHAEQGEAEGPAVLGGQIQDPVGQIGCRRIRQQPLG